MSSWREGADSPAQIEAASRRRLTAIAAVDITTAVVELFAGQFAGSQALQADALEFLAIGITSGIWLWGMGRPAGAGRLADLLKSLALMLLGIWVAATTLIHFFIEGLPDAATMGVIGLLALCANLCCVWLLAPGHDGDAASSFLHRKSWSDLIATAAVIVAAALVYVLGNRAPDLVVAGVIVALFLTNTGQSLRQSFAEWQRGT